MIKSQWDLAKRSPVEYVQRRERSSQVQAKLMWNERFDVKVQKGAAQGCRTERMSRGEAISMRRDEGDGVRWPLRRPDPPFTAQALQPPRIVDTTTE